MRKKTNVMYPWDNIPAPMRKEDVNSILYSDLPLPSGVTVEWIKFYDSSVGISIFFDEYKGAPITLPTFKVLNLGFRLHAGNKKSCVQIVLCESDMQELFYRLCLDLAESLSKGTRFNVLNRIIVRLEEWRHLLSSAQRKLSKREQKGLIGELEFLKDIVLEELEPKAAVESWTGPAGSPRDFTFGMTYFEIKTNRGTQDHSVIISSENQLTTEADEKLFLCVLGVNEDPATGSTLDELVQEVREYVKQDPAALRILNKHLRSAGYSDAADYSDTKWANGSFRYYYVAEQFPKIVPSSIPQELSEVSYRLDLSHLDRFESDEETIRARTRC